MESAAAPADFKSHSPTEMNDSSAAISQVGSKSGMINGMISH